MDRRQFIKVSAITGTSAALASCGSPENQLIRFVPDEDLVPGIATMKPSVCPVCSAGCGLTVRVMEGDVDVVRDGQAGLVKMGLAKKLDGAPTHPISQGKLCPRGQAAIQITYHPDRLQGPMKRSGDRGAGQFQPTTWDEAIAELVKRLDGLAAANNQKAFAWITRQAPGRRLELIREFLARYGAPAPITFELFGDDVLRRANAISFGREQTPTLDLAHTRYLISFGADFLGTWNSVVAQHAAYGAMRQGRFGVRGHFVQVEPRMSQTGANADEWVAVRPGTEGALALGLAHVIMRAGSRPGASAGRAGAAIPGWSDGLTTFTPAEVEKRTGVKAARIERLAREFAEHGPAIAVIAGAPLAHTNGLFQALAVNALNALVGSVNEPGGLRFMPQHGLAYGGKTASAPSSGHGALADLARTVATAPQSPVQLLVVDGVNPVFATPTTWRVADALQKIPFIVSLGGFVDDTSAMADLILPDHSFLESWIDALPESGSTGTVASVAPPAIRPLYQTRATVDVVLDVSRRLQKPVSPALPQTYEEALSAAFAGLAPGAKTESGEAVDVWAKAQEQAGWWSAPSAPAATAPADRSGAAQRSVEPATSQALEVEARPDGDAAQFPFQFLPYPSQSFLDGSLAHLPWLQELPDPVTSGMWSTWVEINPQTAERLQIALGDLVEVTSRHGAVRAPAVIFPGIAPDAIAMPVGQGHKNFTRYASGRGANPIAILAPVAESVTGALAWAATRVQIARVGTEQGRLVLFAAEMREHPGHGHR